jgi:hypothetical protein
MIISFLALQSLLQAPEDPMCEVSLALARRQENDQVGTNPSTPLALIGAHCYRSNKKPYFLPS